MQQLGSQEIFIEPPLHFAPDHIFDLNFHPQQDVLAIALITGEVQILKYSQEEVQDVATFHHHKLSARISQFSPSGQTLLTASKDQSYAILDSNGKLIMQKLDCFKNAINAAKYLNENLVALGDDDGRIKVGEFLFKYQIFDLRTNQSVYSIHQNEEAISAFEIDNSMNFLLSTSLDGYLGVFDLRVSSNAKSAVYAMSDCMDEDLTGLCLVKCGKFVCVSTSQGNLMLFKWDFFGDFKDRITGHPSSIDALLKLDEQTVLTGCEDGLLRGVSIFPNSIDGILGQHEENEQFPITKIDKDRSGMIVASISHDSSIKFYEIVEYCGKRKGIAITEAPDVFPEKKKQEAGNEDDFEDEQSSDDEEMSEEEKQPKKKVRTRNLKQSQQQVKEKKFQQFFDKL